MSTFSPPTFIYFSPNQQDEECSCMTQLSENVYPSQDGIKLSADPYFFYTLDKRRSEKTEKSEKQELMDLRMQVVRQQEKITRLESKLCQALVENEELKAEKSTMAEQLTSSIQGLPLVTRRSWSSGEVNNESNACQEVINGVMRKSFQKHIKDSRRLSIVDKETIEKLQQENDALKQQLDTVPQKVLVRQGTVKTVDATEVGSSFQSSYQTDQSPSWFIRELAEKEKDKEEERDCGDVIQYVDECLIAKKLFSARSSKTVRINRENTSCELKGNARLQ